VDSDLRQFLILSVGAVAIFGLLGLLLFIQGPNPITIITSYAVVAILYVAIAWIGMAGVSGEW
jgi:hypothetical protein